MGIRYLLTTVALASGCSGEITGATFSGVDGGSPGGPDGPTGPASLRISAPAPDSVHAREVLDEDGFLVAQVGFAAEASGAIERVEYLGPGGTVLGEATGPNFAAEVTFAADGVQQIDAIGYDGAGVELASATVRFAVAAPTLSDCYEWLDMYGVTYTRGPANQGVPEPVTVTTPIGGLRHRYVSNQTPRATFFMDCSLARSLAQAAPYLRARDVVEVVDIGVYNYRCIGSGTPPDCPSGLSQHAYARAIDIAGLVTADGTYYSVNDDWVIDPAGESTCSAATEPGKDRFLHETICELKQAGVWAIVLTPNYNAAHRDHWHVDLTPGSNFIRRLAPLGVDEGPDLH